MTKQDDLTASLFDGQPHLLSAELMQWLESSPRFTAFVDAYHNKIRKKIRVTRDPESIMDLRGELQVAYCLLNDRRLEVTYEPYASAKRRGPDFAVTYRTNLVFNVEVARIRAEEAGPKNAGITGLVRQEEHLAPQEERILRTVLEKLGQMQPAMPNLLVVHAKDDLRQSIDLGRTMQALKTRVEKKDFSFHIANRYTSPADFYKEFLRLSAILLWAPEAVPWVNKQARPELEEKVLRLVGSLVPGSAS